MEEEFQNILRTIADSLVRFYKGRAPVDTGALRNSIRAEVRSSGEIAVIYNQYGAYQDLGVRGVVSSNKAPNSPFQFKDKRTQFGALSPVGGNLPYGARVNIRKFGLTPKNWITDSNGNPIIPNNILQTAEIDLANYIEKIVSTTTERIQL